MWKAEVVQGKGGRLFCIHIHSMNNNLENTVNSLIVTTSCKRPPPISNHFVNNCFVSQLNTVSRAVF